jgi:hypothetical protein
MVQFEFFEVKYEVKGAIAALLAGVVGYLPILLWPRDVFYDPITELAPSLVLALPCYLGTKFGRFVRSPGCSMNLRSGRHAAATMSCLAKRWG